MILERQADLHPEEVGLALFDHHVLLDHFRDPEVLQGLGSRFYGILRCRLPGIGTRSHQLDDLVNAVRHRHSPSFARIGQSPLSAALIVL